MLWRSMARPREPQLATTFLVRLAGREALGTFREISGLSSETVVAEESGVDEQGRPFVRKVPGATKFANITLKRGLDSNLDLWKWRQQVIREGPDAASVDGTIELFDAAGRPVTTYRFIRGWPSKYSGPDLNAASNELAIEGIEITHEGLERT